MKNFFRDNPEPKRCGILPYPLVEREHTYIRREIPHKHCRREVYCVQGTNGFVRKSAARGLHDFGIHSA